MTHVSSFDKYNLIKDNIKILFEILENFDIRIHFVLSEPKTFPLVLLEEAFSEEIYRLERAFQTTPSGFNQSRKQWSHYPSNRQKGPVDSNIWTDARFHSI